MRRMTTGFLVPMILLLFCSMARGGHLEARPNVNYYMFATSESFTGGAVNSLGNADDLVTLYAFLGNLIPSWNGVDRLALAVLSDSTTSARDRVADFVSPNSADVISVYDRNDQLIGRWNAPTQTQAGISPGDFTGFAAVTFDENASLIGHFHASVWTGSLADGTYSGQAASDWTSNASVGTYGFADQGGPGNLDAADGPASEARSLYGLVAKNGNGGTVDVWVPEPSTMTLAGFGFAALAAWRLRKRSRVRRL
jgi:hypothetical protein